MTKSKPGSIKRKSFYKGKVSVMKKVELFSKSSDYDNLEIVEEIKTFSPPPSPKKSSKITEKHVKMYSISSLIKHFEKKFDIDLSDYELDVSFFKH